MDRSMQQHQQHQQQQQQQQQQEQQQPQPLPQPSPEAILEWVQKEMGYPDHAPLPSPEQLRKACRGNMLPVWTFLLRRVRSEKTVSTVRRNILVHGGMGPRMKEDWEKACGGQDERESALRERHLAEEDVFRLRKLLLRQRKELRARMADLSKEESDRKRLLLDDTATSRHKKVMLEAYDQQCDEAAKIFAEYQRRLQYYVNQARDAHRSTAHTESSVDSANLLTEKEAIYSTTTTATAVKGNRSSDNVILVETARERSIRKACETLSANMIDRVKASFPAYEGTGVHWNSQLEASKLVSELDAGVQDDVKAFVLDALRNPPLLLQALSLYASRIRNLIQREMEKIDVRADAELLRYKYENDRVTDDSLPDASSPLHYQVYANGNGGSDFFTKGTCNQLLERQKAHVQQFVDTEDALNNAAKAKSLIQSLIKRLHGGSDAVTSQTVVIGGSSQPLGTIRHFELEVWAKEREAAGLRASLNTLNSEVERLNKLCIERKEAEDSLRKKWKKIEEFDARRSELEAITTALLRANMDASAFWEQQPLAAREHASKTILPACAIVSDLSSRAKDLIEKEVSAFDRCLDNSLYMLPSTPQALLEYMGSNGTTGPEAIAVAEKNAAVLTARAGTGDPSAIPSVSRVSAALQVHSGREGSDTGLASVLESLDFCLKLRGSEASVLEELSKAINLVNIKRDLVENDHILLNHAHRMQHEFDRTVDYCLKLASEQENLVIEKWLLELKNAVLNAQNCLEDCRRVRGLVDEWWGQPAATAVDWVLVDGQNVAAWLNLVKQLQMTFYDKELL